MTRIPGENGRAMTLDGAGAKAMTTGERAKALTTDGSGAYVPPRARWRELGQSPRDGFLESMAAS